MKILFGKIGLLLLCGMLLIGSAGVRPGSLCAASGQQTEPLVFRNQIVFDQQFMGLEVFRMLIPKDWRFEGGIT